MLFFRFNVFAPLPEIEAQQNGVYRYGIKECKGQKWYGYFFLAFLVGIHCFPPFPMRACFRLIVVFSTYCSSIILHQRVMENKNSHFGI